MVEDITPDTIRKARRMLTILAASTPQTSNITELSRNLGMDRKQGIKILYLLQRAGLTGLLAEDADALKYLGAPSKIFCDNGISCKPSWRGRTRGRCGRRSSTTSLASDM